MPRSWPVVLLYTVFAVFVCGIGYLVASSLSRHSVPVFAPRATRARPPDWESRGDTLTVDASDADRWQFVSLSRGAVLDARDTAGWELAVRRFHIMAAGGMADAGQVGFDGVRVPGDREFVVSSGRDSSNAATRRWYRYNFLSHLLEPNGHVYVLRTPAGRTLKMTILSYYCPGPTAGCLTLRYAPVRQ